MLDDSIGTLGSDLKSSSVESRSNLVDEQERNISLYEKLGSDRSRKDVKRGRSHQSRRSDSMDIASELASVKS